MSGYQAIVIGCSTGGVRALSLLLGGLTPALRVPVIVVCHTGGEDVDMLREVLSLKSALPVLEATERREPLPGQVYLAPSGYHLLLEADHCFALSVDERVCYSRPAIDVLFASAATQYGAQLIGVVLTGANEDGADGLKRIRDNQGLAIVQAPEDAEASAMPAAAIARAGADYIVPLTGIAPILNRLCSP